MVNVPELKRGVLDSVIDAIGNTPIVRLNNITEDLDAEVDVKMESFNPTGSVKDRVAVAMIEDAEEKGLLKEGSVIIEPTSGNTGIGLGFAAAAKGYRLILTMPETMSVERRKLLGIFGAELVLTPGSEGMGGAIAKANELEKEIPDGIVLHQFDNEANTRIHSQTTAKEILRDTEGKIDAVVAGVGTGGTITGIGKVLKEENPDVQIIAVEPESSQTLGKGVKGPHKSRVLVQVLFRLFMILILLMKLFQLKMRMQVILYLIWLKKKEYLQEFPLEQQHGLQFK